MSIRNFIKGDDNQTLLMFCHHFNCGNVDIKHNIIKNVKKMYIDDIYSHNIMIDDIDVKNHLMNLNNNVNSIKDNKIPYLENKVIELQNQIIELQKVINELTNINLIN